MRLSLLCSGAAPPRGARGCVEENHRPRNPGRSMLAQSRPEEGPANAASLVEKRNLIECAPSFNQEARLLAEKCVERYGLPTETADFTSAYRVRGEFNLRALERALNSVIARHQALRTAFLPTEWYSDRERGMQLSCFTRTAQFLQGMYVQKIAEEALLTVRVKEACYGGTSLDGARLSSVMEEEASTPLDKTVAPLMRATVVRFSDDVHVLVLVMSHLVFDGWSVGVFERELASLYTSLRSGQPGELPTVPIQYPEFSEWENFQFHSGGFNREVLFWSRHWRDAAGTEIRHRDLPIAKTVSRSRPVIRTESKSIDSQESAKIRETAARCGVTPNAFFRTAVAILLHAYCRKARLTTWANFSASCMARATWLQTSLHGGSELMSVNTV